MELSSLEGLPLNMSKLNIYETITCFQNEKDCCQHQGIFELLTKCAKPLGTTTCRPILFIALPDSPNYLWCCNRFEGYKT